MLKFYGVVSTVQENSIIEILEAESITNLETVIEYLRGKYDEESHDIKKHVELPINFNGMIN